MDIKIANCLRDVSELKEKIQETLILQKEIEKEENRYNSSMQTQFKYLKSDIKFLHENIIRTFPYIKVENEEDVEAMKGIIEFVQTAQFCSLNEDQKTQITKALFALGKGRHARELQDYSNSLSEKDEQYIDGVVDSADIVISSLHNAFNSGKSNAVVDRVFNEYYSLRKFIERNVEDNDYGKGLMKKIVSDPEISKEHKAMVKKAYQDYKIESKYLGLNLGKRIVAGTTGVFIAPFVVAGLAERLGTGIVKCTGELVQLATNFLALPFDTLAMKMLEKSDSKATKFGAVLVDIPGMVLKGAGALTNGILKIGAGIIDLTFNLATIPFSLIASGILKLGKVNVKDRIKENDKKINKNIASILSEKGEKVKHKDIIVEYVEVGEKDMVVFGKNLAGDFMGEDFRLTFAVDEEIISKLKTLEEKQAELNKILSAVNVLEHLTDQKLPTDKTKELEDELLGLVYSESQILSNVTTQKPIENISDVITDIDDELDFIDEAYEDIK